MRVLLLLAALASPAVAATPAPPSPPVASPPRASSAPDDRQEAPQRLPSKRIYDRNSAPYRPMKPNPEGKPGPGIG
jgi:hypothetical protein